MKKLLNSFSQQGTERASFSHAVSALTDITEVIHLPGKDITFYVITSQGSELLSCTVDPSTDGYGVCLNIFGSDGIEEVAMRDWSPELKDEALSLGRLFISYSDPDTGELIFAGCANLASDLTVFGISGDAAQIPSYHLYGLVAQRVQNKKVTLCIRKAITENGTVVRKVFALRSGGYMYVPQTDAMEIAEKVCSQGVLKRWSIDHFETQALFEFPTYAVFGKYGRGEAVKWTPCVRYGTSDMGDGSLLFELGWRTDSFSFPVFLASGKGSASRKHLGDWRKARPLFEKEAFELLNKLTILPDQMAKQNAIILNSTDFEPAVKNLIDDCKILALGKHLSEALLKATVSAIETESSVTGAELIFTLMEAADKITNLSDAQRLSLSHGLAEAPYKKIRGAITW